MRECEHTGRCFTTKANATRFCEEMHTGQMYPGYDLVSTFNSNDWVAGVRNLCCCLLARCCCLQQAGWAQKSAQQSGNTGHDPAQSFPARRQPDQRPAPVPCSHQRQRHHPCWDVRAEGMQGRHRHQLLRGRLPPRRAHLQACVEGRARGASMRSLLVGIAAVASVGISVWTRGSPRLVTHCRTPLLLPPATPAVLPAGEPAYNATCYCPYFTTKEP